MKTDNLTEQQKIDITFQTNALGEAISKNAALRCRLETLEQKLQALTEAKGHNQHSSSELNISPSAPLKLSLWHSIFLGNRTHELIVLWVFDRLQIDPRASCQV